MLNLHQLFDKVFENDCFRARLDVNAAERAALFAARREIRNCLRAAISAATKRLGPEQEIAPKFLTQGSCAYGTLNDPAHCPPQEIDLDDGVYLPMSLMQGTPPSRVCDEYFKFVDAALEDLCKKRGWKIDKTRARCTRVHISPRAHIDVPLYAIPDTEYQRLTQAAAKYGYKSLSEALSGPTLGSWIWLSSDQVWIAVRGGSWERSDPRMVHDWFERLKTTYGDQFLRVCRYLKAWRDYQWSSGGPSSILLMLCIGESFKRHHGRDDLALYDVTKLLSNQLMNDIRNDEVNPGAQLNMLDAAERQEASIKAMSLSSALHKAIFDATDAVTAIDILIAQFGRRIPTNDSWVKALTRTDVVQATARAVVPAPAIQRTTAG